MKHLLEVKNLKVSFDTYAGEVQAVRGVSFHLDQGETLAIVGESGCGKSVSIQTVMRIVPMPPARIKEGSILYNGEELADKSDAEMEQYRGNEMAMIFQDSMTSLNPTMRVGKQLMEGILKHQKTGRDEARRRVLAMLKEVGIPDPESAFRRYPHTMSGGQRQRVMIAMALCCGPKILFADEPTTALDVTMQAQILDLIGRLQRQYDMGVVLITHDLGVVAKMADRINVMYAGRIVESGTSRQIFYHPSHPYTLGLLGAMPNLIQERKEELYNIPGAPPDLFAPPPGCAFAGRCRYCMGVCRRADAPEFTTEDGHISRCWLLDERGKKYRPEGFGGRTAEKGGSDDE
ncbi:MAG: ABC transporter ATP-binding protein [Lachnospiraceae bacterium]|jgi:oligopeptide transport system ATP-binding protein|nr:ABC transporter ATP-binding protein [Lachnospiraceae bacterium]